MQATHGRRGVSESRRDARETARRGRDFPAHRASGSAGVHSPASPRKGRGSRGARRPVLEPGNGSRRHFWKAARSPPRGRPGPPAALRAPAHPHRHSLHELSTSNPPPVHGPRERPRGGRWSGPGAAPEWHRSGPETAWPRRGALGTTGELAPRRAAHAARRTPHAARRTPRGPQGAARGPNAPSAKVMTPLPAATGPTRTNASPRRRTGARARDRMRRPRARASVSRRSACRASRPGRSSGSGCRS